MQMGLLLPRLSIRYFAVLRRSTPITLLMLSMRHWRSFAREGFLHLGGPRLYTMVHSRWRIPIPCPPMHPTWVRSHWELTMRFLRTYLSQKNPTGQCSVLFLRVYARNGHDRRRIKSTTRSPPPCPGPAKTVNLREWGRHCNRVPFLRTSKTLLEICMRMYIMLGEIEIS
jgi:hypothetical protein